MLLSVRGITLVDGRDPEAAAVRPSEVVGRYEQ
jgi:hypothetical protein